VSRNCKLNPSDLFIIVVAREPATTWQRIVLFDQPCQKQTVYIYNNVKFQDRDGYVNTCGSHVVHRLYRLKNDNMKTADLPRLYEVYKGRVR
ncbi:MAG: hypothetical protein ACKPKO_11970, partial [Candidatus Fonsibacter sp.]